MFLLVFTYTGYTVVYTACKCYAMSRRAGQALNGTLETTRVYTACTRAKWDKQNEKKTS